MGTWVAGENRAVDAAVVCDGHLLLVRRRDGMGWALPGGFVEAGEDDAAAMRRELAEETGVDVAGVEPRLVGGRVLVADPRNTSDRWITTQLGLFRLAVRPLVVAGDDAAEVRWVPLVGFDAMDRLVFGSTGVGMFPAHRPLVDAVEVAA